MTEEALARFAESLERSRVLGDFMESAWAHFYRSLIFQMKGDFSSALLEADRSRGFSLKLGSRGLMAMSDCILIHIYSITNKNNLSELIDQELKSVLDEQKEIKKGSPLRGLAEVASAEVLFTSGKFEDACSTAKRGFDHLAKAELGHMYQAIGNNWLGDLCLKIGRPDLAHPYLHAARQGYVRLGNEGWALRMKERLEVPGGDGSDASSLS
jgi:hypothetical protein